MQRKDIQAVLIIVVFYAAIELAGITCPIRFLTGISCAGCGMSRAWLALLRLDFSAAFAYHPLFWLPVPVAAVLLLCRRIPQRVFRGVLAVVVALFLAVYVIRIFTPEDTVVTFTPSQGLIWRVLSSLWS